MVLAGAGAGKTKTITYRMAHMIAQGIPPSRILAVTFTNKAAKEMLERITHLLSHTPEVVARFPTGIPRPVMGTFHSLGVRMLRENAIHIGIAPNFSIWDRSDSTKAVLAAIKSIGEDPKRYEPKAILGRISGAKGDGVQLAEYRTEARTPFEQITVRVWEKYDAVLKKEGALDFDDLLLKNYLMLRDVPAIRAKYHDRWHYLLVDEYQDTNKIQYETVRLLSEKRGNICVVGDLDQSIYSWRGAQMEYLLNFDQTFPGALTVVLEQNYRSTQTVLRAANAVIQKNVRRKEKNLFTENAEGEPITVFTGTSETDEAQFVATQSARLIRQGVIPKDIAVLYRTNFLSRALEEQMLSWDIPYQVLGTKFFERKEVKDILSYLRAAINPNTPDITRVIGVPSRGIGKVTLEKMLEGRLDELSGSQMLKVQDFYALLKRVKDKAENAPVSETLKYIVTESGLEKELLAGGADEQERLENIRELVTLALKYNDYEPLAGANKLLEDAALMSDQDELEDEGGGVSLMTVHSSKGLEFKYVFIVGLEDGLFPHERMGSDEKRDDEEERRLFYVALTRARLKLFLTHAHMRTVYGNREFKLPSEFLTDIPPELVEGHGEKAQVTLGKKPKSRFGFDDMWEDIIE
jgi:DNA helicase II / ATP-dependent DNA helicase PcrA